MTTPDDFFASRNPMLSQSEGDDIIDRVFQTDSSVNWNVGFDFSEFSKLEKKNIILSSIYISSPSLYNKLITWETTPSEKQDKSLPLSLLKFCKRMSERCTPYGLFATLSCGTISKSDQTQLTVSDSYYLDVKLDLGFLNSIIRLIVSDVAAYPHLSYELNSSLIKTGDQWRFVEKALKGSKVDYKLSAVTSNIYIDSVVELLSHKDASFQEVFMHLERNFPDENRDTIHGFICDLIKEEVLVWNVGVCVTSEDPLEHFLKQIEKIPFLRQHYDYLSNVNTAFRSTRSPSDLSAAGVSKIDNLHVAGPIKTSEGNFIHVDTFRHELSPILNEKTTKIIQEQVQEVSGCLSSLTTYFDEFKSRFLQRYGEVEVPLLMALDADIGIPLGAKKVGSNPLIEGLNLHKKVNGANLSQSKLQERLLKKIFNDNEESNEVVYLTEDDVLESTNEKNRLADNFSILGSILYLKGSTNSDADWVCELKAIDNSLQLALLGRFCGGDEALDLSYKAYLSNIRSENSKKIYAEVVHLPQGRVGNVLRRPKTTEYEITYLGNSSLPKENTILCSDIMISIQQNKILLRSIKLNKYIIPTFSSMHGFDNDVNLSVYRFLAAIAQDHEKRTFFSWGSVNRYRDYLPRVQYKNIILSRAQWKVTYDQFKSLHQKKYSDKVQQGLILKLNELGIPMRVLLTFLDNKMSIDFNKHNDVKIFFSELKQKKVCYLEEMLDEYKSPFVSSSNLTFQNEIVLPFKGESAGHSSERKAAESERLVSIQIAREIEKQWMYFKVYIGPGSVDKFLREAYSKIRNVAVENNCEKAFFIRYADPDWHIRLRIKLTETSSYQKILEKVSEIIEPYRDSGIISKVLMDEYQPEFQRYGGTELTSLAESLFDIDSYICALGLHILSTSGHGLSKNKAYLALHMNLQLAASFVPEADRMSQVFKVMAQSFKTEFDLSKEDQKLVNGKFREFKYMVSKFFGSTELEGGFEQGIKELINQYGQLIKPVAEKIMKLSPGKGDIETLLGSYLHMTNNRIFADDARAQEMVVYEVVFRSIESEIARKKYS